MELDTEPLLEEAERIETQIKVMMENQLGSSGDDDPDDGPNAMLYGGSIASHSASLSTDTPKRVAFSNLDPAFSPATK